MMKFAIFFATTALAVTGVLSTPLSNIKMDSLSQKNRYGSPLAPWENGAKPGWYYGSSPNLYPDIPCLGNPQICHELSNYPDGLQCPKNPPPPKTTTTPPYNSTSTPPSTTPSSTTSSTTAPTPTPTPPPGYTPTFSNITCATQAGDYMTFGLVDTEADCLAMCNSVAGCNFVNVYHDLNGKGGSTQFSCSLFTLCHNKFTADNCGGQSQPSGLLDFIADSDGFCKNGVTVSDPPYN